MADEKKKSAKKSTASKKAKRTGSNIYDQFTERQIAEFKEGFQMMDVDKDGMIGKSDLRSTIDEVGHIATDADIDDMLKDAPGPINFTMLINMFAQRQQGGQSDDDDVVISALKAFQDENGQLDSEQLRHALTTWGEKYTSKEAEDFFDQVEIDEKGKISCSFVAEMLTGKAEVKEKPAENADA